MGIIQSLNAQDFKGLHLYHAEFSNCAMRVRIVLAEKNLSWTSHLLDLLKGDNLTKEYFSLNPNGVVPTLIDDGVVIIDSADIIDYLDKKFQPYTLRPQSCLDEKTMFDWIYLARDHHLSFKTYLYSYLDKLNQGMKKSQEQMAQYQKKQTFDAKLLAFHKRFNTTEGFSKDELDRATAQIDVCFNKINSHLKHNRWLAGEEFSLADIAWLPQWIILQTVNYPFESYQYLKPWLEAIKKRPSFKQSVLDWLPNTKSILS